MTFKDIKQLSNQELNLYQINLRDEFDSTKVKIENLCKYLETLDREYNKVNVEKNNRKSGF